MDPIAEGLFSVYFVAMGVFYFNCFRKDNKSGMQAIFISMVLMVIFYVAFAHYLGTPVI